MKNINDMTLRELNKELWDVNRQIDFSSFGRWELRYRMQLESEIALRERLKDDPELLGYVQELRNLVNTSNERYLDDGELRRMGELRNLIFYTNNQKEVQIS